MIVDLVDVTTPEGIMLSGAYFSPTAPTDDLTIDAILFFMVTVGISTTNFI